ncbi:molybdopterin oxidoreductase family protein [Halioglobus maricola]|uniref:Molybdopterin oxidoreductase family protein n=1 Tax=Halioglobus maricola TaxID=2601894 RepID=A0A5P9NKP9_9GAMM|nr:molybdopterin-dependent oxidoreductase [Halioglobus maricola]QFU76179.1 molybdopterin oxidoreductase family protein [Halioglobus maricola]
MSEVQKHYRTCNICEAMCGIEVQYQGTEVIAIKPDKDDVFSRGHICPKAVALQDYYHDPDRLQTPVKRTAEGWESISWDEAMAEIGSRMRGIQDEYGADAVGVYLGNPNAHNFGNALMFQHFFKALGSRSRFSSASADQLPHHVAANYMFGAGMVIPIADIDHTDYMMIIGGNPVVSNGSMMTSAGVPGRIKDIKARDGKVVTVDPRFTETSKIASEHVFIRPEADALFLMALINVIFAEGLAELGHLSAIVEGVATLQAAAAEFTPEAIAERTGIPAEDTRRLAREFATAPSAVCYSRMGASTQSFGTLCQWLTNCLNIITGNCDRRGGAMFPRPAFDLLANTPRGKPSSFGRYRSRVRQLPYNNGEFPVATLAEEILTPGEGQVRAMFTIAGNPVLSAPGGDGLDAAFESLEFMVAVDIYINETTRHADIILPATHGLEVPHFDVFFNSFAVRNTVKFSEALFEKTGDQKPDWQILKLLATALTGKPDDGTTPEMILDMALTHGHYGGEGMSLEKLRQHPHGIDLGPLEPWLDERLKTAEGNIFLAPEIFLEDLTRLREFMSDGASEAYPFAMIGRRLARNHNTWTHNSYRLIKGRDPVTLQLNSADAAKLGVTAGDTVAVRSQNGRVEMPVEVDDHIMPGVVSIPQGWGHNRKGTQMSVAEGQPGISINTLTDVGRVDPVSGNAAFNGTPVAVEKLAS